MEETKKWTRIEILLSIFILIIVAFIISLSGYKVQNEYKSIDKFIGNHFKISDDEKKFEIMEIAELKDAKKLLVSIRIDESTAGYAVFTKHYFLNKYKFEHMGYGGYMQYHHIESKFGSDYVFLVGENKSGEIKTAKANLHYEDMSIDFKIPQKDYYLVYKKISKDLKHPDVFDSFDFYNEKGEELYLGK